MVRMMAMSPPWWEWRPPPLEKKERQPRIWNLKPHLKPQTAEQRDPQLPTTVRMPRAVEDITDAGMRAMWEMNGEAAQEPLD